MISDEQDTELGDFLPSEENVEKTVMDSFLYDEEINLINSLNLNDRERNILLLRNGFINNRVYTLEEIAKIFNLTKERIR